MTKPSSAHATEHATHAHAATASAAAHATQLAPETSAVCLILAACTAGLWFFTDGEAPAPTPPRHTQVEQAEPAPIEVVPAPTLRRQGPLDARRRLRPEGTPRHLAPTQLDQPAIGQEPAPGH